MRAASRHQAQRTRRVTLIMAVPAGILAGVAAIAVGAFSTPAQDQPASPRLFAAASVRAAPEGQTIADVARPAIDLRVDEFLIHVPANVREPSQVLVVLHGMGSSGEDESLGLRSLTDQQGWVLVAPTFQYGDWREPGQVTGEAVRHGPRILQILDQLPSLTGLSVRPRVLLYGFSRGGQTANRFCLLYPERVAGVAMASSGTYTLPVAGWADDSAALQFPYGVADFRETFGRDFSQDTFRRIPFWIGIGGGDNDAAAVPHQWDPYIGHNRVERAQRFAAVLAADGVRAEVHVFPQTGHEETDQTRRSAIEFLASVQ